MEAHDGWRLQLAYAGLHPDSVGGLLDAHGAEGAVARVAGSRTGSDRSRAAVAVPAVDRLDELAKLGFDVVFRHGAGYPPSLAHLPGAPDVLFVRGTLEAVSSVGSVAVVGTRRCSPYGRNLAEAYGRAIGAAGWVLISGLARGIDGAAHRGTVASQRRGVAVLGCGLDVAYPREHLLRRGAFRPGTGSSRV